jgi:hypothetical protein
MARTEHLPIYKASYDLCLYLEQVVRGFSRYHKYTLGTDLRDGGASVCEPPASRGLQAPAFPARRRHRPLRGPQRCPVWTRSNGYSTHCDRVTFSQAPLKRRTHHTSKG